MRVGEHRTCLEKQMYGYLVELGLEPEFDFYEQHPEHGFILDFAFIKSRKPFRGVDIEVDGVKWHGSAEARQRDGYRTYLLMKCGWLVERFGEQFTIEQVKDVLLKHKILSS